MAMTPAKPGRETPSGDRHQGKVLLHERAGYNATCACGWGRWTDTRVEAEALLVEHTRRNNQEEGQDRQKS
jgi:hypothetical protein